MFDRKSDYALNKRHPDSIVCKSVTDAHVYLTRADFSSEADFRKWKEWSDRNYHQMDKAGRGFYDNCLPLDERIDSMEPSAEELLLRGIEQAGKEENCAVLMAKIKSCLSTTQFRRLWMHYAEGKCLLYDILSLVFIAQPAESDLIQFEGIGFIKFLHPCFICWTHKHLSSRLAGTGSILPKQAGKCNPAPGFQPKPGAGVFTAERA